MGLFVLHFQSPFIIKGSQVKNLEARADAKAIEGYY